MPPLNQFTTIRLSILVFNTTLPTLKSKVFQLHTDLKMAAIFVVFSRVFVKNIRPVSFFLLLANCCLYVLT